MFVQQIQVNGDDIVFNGDYLECYIPEYYMDTNYAEQIGNTLKIFGVFSLRTFTKGKPNKLETLSLPMFINLSVSDIEKKELTLIPGREPEVFYVAKFFKGNKLMSKYIMPDSSNVEIFLNMMLRGKVPNTIPYDKIIQIWHSNLKLNNVNIGTTSTILEIIISKIYRDKNNPDKNFASVAGKGEVSQYDYKTANIREICARESTFTAITFEDMDSMLTTSLNTRDKSQQIVSPIEKIIKM